MSIPQTPTVPTYVIYGTESASNLDISITFSGEQLSTIFANAISAIRFAANSTKSFFGIPEERYMFGSFRLVSIIPIAIDIPKLAHSILGIGKDCINAVKVSASEAIDTALEIIGNIGSIGGNISTFADGLAAVSVVAIEAIKWSTPLLFVSLGLEAIGMAYHVKAFAENHFLSEKLETEAALNKAAEEYTTEDFSKGLSLIASEQSESRNFVGKQFGVNSERLIERLHQIEGEALEKVKTGDDKQKIEAQHLMHSTMHSLKNRLITTQLSHAVNIVATSVGIIGVLLLFTPAAPVGFGFLAATAVFSIANLINRLIQTKQFAEALKL